MIKKKKSLSTSIFLMIYKIKYIGSDKPLSINLFLKVKDKVILVSELYHPILPPKILNQ